MLYSKLLCLYNVIKNYFCEKCVKTPRPSPRAWATARRARAARRGGRAGSVR